MLKVALSENIVVAEGTKLCYKVCCSCCWAYPGFSSRARCWWHWTLLQASAFEANVAAVCAVLVALRCVTQCVVLADGSIVVVAVAAFGAAASVQRAPVCSLPQCAACINVQLASVCSLH